MHRILTAMLATALFVGLAPAAQAQFNPLSIIKGAVEAAAEDRSSGDIAKDLEIKTAITSKIVDQMGSDVISINADVYEQDALLTGSVETAAQRKQAGAIARGIKGIKKLYNEILVVKDLDKKKGAAENFVDDSVIEGKINALLLDAKGVNVTNFRWRSVGGHAFLFGRALSKGELAKAIAVVKGIKNVTEVTEHVKVVPK